MAGISNPTVDPLIISSLQIHFPQEHNLHAKIFLVEYYNVTTASRWFELPGVRGRWPDPLIPLASLDQGHTFALIDLKEPLTVPPYENRIFYFEFYLPALAQQRIETECKITFITEDKKEFEILLNIQPWSFNLPRCSTVRTAVGFSPQYLPIIHQSLSKQEYDEEALYLSYLHLLALHKIFIFNPYYQRIPVLRDEEGAIEFDFQGFDKLTGAMLEGTLFPDAPPANTFRMPGAEKGLTEQEKRLYYSKLIEHLKQRDWFDYMFYYVMDEPLII